MSIASSDLRNVPRRIGVVGGPGKYRAIRAALRGGWVNVLVTDLDTARGLAEDADSPIAAGHELPAGAAARKARPLSDTRLASLGIVPAWLCHGGGGGWTRPVW
jgi:Putative sugar-binding domain